MLFGKQDWTSQPQFITGIDRTNPITRGLAFAWNAATWPIEALSGAQASTTKVSVSSSIAGRVTNNSQGQVNIEWAKQFITTSDGAGTGDFTLLVVANPAAAGDGTNLEHILAQKNDAAGTPYAQSAFLAHATALSAYASGNFAFFTYSGVGVAAVAAGACDGAYHVWIGTRIGTTSALYKDGVLIASSVDTVQQITQSGSQRYMAVGSRGNGTTQSYRNNAAAAFGWNRGLSQNEISALSISIQSPWQLFNPRLV